MAMCFYCGPSVKGTHRRWVETGSSEGSFVSYRSAGVSSRAYTGLRTVCARCAGQIDAKKKGNGAAPFVFIAIICAVVGAGYWQRDHNAKAKTVVQPTEMVIPYTGTVN